MVNLSTRAAVAAAGLLLAGSLAVAPVAFAADDATGPGTPGCLTAQDVVKIRIGLAATAAINVEDASAKLSDAEKATIARLQDEFAALQVKLDVALTALRTAPSKANQDAAIDLGDKLNKKAAELALAPGAAGLGEVTQKLIDANANLKAAFDKQKVACDGPVVATPTPTTTPAPSTTPAPDDTFYASCDAVRDAGKSPLGRSEPGYRDALDSDGDGLACEVVEGVPAAPGAVPVPSQIDTGKP